MSLTYSSTIKAKMQRLFDTCIIAEERYSDIDKHIKQIAKGRDRYETASSLFNIPWYVTGIIHKTTCDCDFKTHLFNGDPLNGRTVSIPVGYPRKGRPPFTWEQSAQDAFLFYHWDKWTDWSIPGVLYNLEAVCRTDYIDEGCDASRLWCFSNHFQSKKQEEEQCGGAILLRRMVEKNIINYECDYSKRLTVLKELGAEIAYLPNRSITKAIELQRLMNISGACLREDGRIGKFSADAYFKITKEHLNGDPRE